MPHLLVRNLEMQCPKRPLEDQDPDYPELQPSDSKKQKLVIDKGASKDPLCFDSGFNLFISQPAKSLVKKSGE